VLRQSNSFKHRKTIAIGEMFDDPPLGEVNEIMLFVKPAVEVLLDRRNDPALICPTDPHRSILAEIHSAHVRVVKEHFAMRRKDRKPVFDLRDRMMEFMALYR
jgi:hypothetical protein